MIFAFVIGLLFQTTDIELGGKKLTVEIANTDELRERGLMNRYHLDRNKGMLFVFDKPRPLSFWMKNTKIPLSIAFFDEQKKLIHHIDMPPPSTGFYPSYRSEKPALYALEVNLGWFQDNGIEPSMKFSFLDSKD